MLCLFWPTLESSLDLKDGGPEQWNWKKKVDSLLRLKSLLFFTLDTNSMAAKPMIRITSMSMRTPHNNCPPLALSTQHTKLGSLTILLSSMLFNYLINLSTQTGTPILLNPYFPSLWYHMIRSKPRNALLLLNQIFFVSFSSFLSKPHLNNEITREDYDNQSAQCCSNDYWNKIVALHATGRCMQRRPTKWKCG